MVICPKARRIARGFVAVVVALSALGVDNASGAACSVKSGAKTTALVELYTSEGCSSCPPADRWLSTTFAAGGAGATAIPLAFHVDYWDRLGWKDRFASAAHTERQYDAMRANRARFVYTPQVLVQGRDFPHWRTQSATAAVASASAKPPRAEITLDALPRRGSIIVRVTARVPSGPDRKGAALYVALAESGLASEVKAGENAGVRLAHDHVVRVLRAGPAPDANGEIHWDLTLAAPDEAGSATTVVAFVQTAPTGDVLQALALPLTSACAAMR